MTLSPIFKSLCETVDERLVVDAFNEGETDLIKHPLVLSGGVVGVLWVGDDASGRGCLVNLVKREKIPRLGSHWKYRQPATDPSFFPMGSSSTTPAQSPGANCVSPM